MNLLNKFTIKGRIIMTLVFVIILFALFGLYSLVEMTVLGQLTSDLHKHPLKVSNAAQSAATGIIKMHRSMKDVVLSESESDLIDIIRTVNTEENKVYADLDTVKEFILGAEGNELVDGTRKNFADWKKIRNEVVELVMENDREAAARITRNKGAEFVDRLEEEMRTLTTYARLKADGFMESAIIQQDDIVRNTIILLIFIAILLLTIAVLITRSISGSISVLVNTMSEITTSGKFSRVELSGKNEIAEMASQFNGLIDRLRTQFRLREGQNGLNKELSMEQSFEEIATRGLNYICRYTGACSGALFIFNNDLVLYELKASFALGEGRHFSTGFKTGEGVVGQVAAEKRSIMLSHITRGDAAVRTGTQCEPPKTIYALPLFYEELLLGVLEVAFFKKIDEMNRELLDSAGQIISIYLYTSKQNEKVKELLENSRETNNTLTSQAEELQAMNEEARQQAVELQQQNLELEVQRTQVEEANRLKSEFLSNMSHELRTPLNSVNALSSVLLSQAADKLSEDETGYLRIIERNGKHLLGLINDILDLSRIEAGKMDVKIKSFSLPMIIDTVLDSLAPLAENKGLRLIRNIPDGLPDMESDDSRVHQILLNIAGNAVKYTEEGMVTISVSYGSGKACIKIEDTGIGIEEKNLVHIFEEFRQVDGASTRIYQGTGLGLAIARKATELLGGSISVKSKPGQGSVFTVILPLKWEVALPEKAPPFSPVITGGKAGQKEILVVDDQPDTAEMIAGYLDREGYCTITAGSGEKALELAAKRKPSAITLDIQLPGMNGWEVLRILKMNPMTAGIPVITVSVVDGQETAMALGSEGFMTKPVDKRNLLAEVNRICGKESPGGKKSVKQVPPEGVPAGKKRILLVEDNASAVFQVKQVFENEGFHMDVAPGGAEALEFLKHTLPDGIILDLMMQGIDGFQVLDNIRCTPATAGIPVLVLTAKDLTKDDIVKLGTCNVQYFIQKGDVNRTELLYKTKLMVEKMPFSTPGESCPRGNGKDKTTILVIEDNQDSLSAIYAIFKHQYSVVEAVSGEEGLEKIISEPVDLVLLDMSLPGIDGFEVVRKIKMDDSIKNIPVIAVTAMAMRGDREAILAAGCDDYISKPIDPAEIMNRIKMWVKKM